jgi:uncharacterized membrane protein
MDGIQNQRVDVGMVINRAFNLWKQHLGLLVLVVVVISVINWAISFPVTIVRGGLEAGGEQELGAIVAFCGQIVVNLVQLYLGIGLTVIALKLARGQRAEFSELFSGARRFLPVLGASILAGFALFFGFLLLIVPGVILCLMFWPFYYLIVDEKTSVVDSFSNAYTVTRGNLGTTFVLWLASVGIILLGLLALCVGVLFAAPLVSMIWAVAYLMMSGQIPTQPAPNQKY